MTDPFQVGSVVVVGRGPYVAFETIALWEITHVVEAGLDAALDLHLLLPHACLDWKNYKRRRQRLFRSEVTLVPEMIVVARMSQ